MRTQFTLALAMVALLASCGSTLGLERLAGYEECISTAADSPKKSKLLTTRSAAAMSELVPYAIVSELLGSVRPERRAEWMWARAIVFMPDAVVYGENTPINVGSRGSHMSIGRVGFGSQRAIYKTPSYGVCCREAPSVIPVRTDDNLMVIDVGDQARGCGLLEGDLLVSINGVVIEKGGNALRSLHHKDRLRIQPGAKVKLGWIRPGTGKLEGEVEALPNPRTYLEEPDCADLSEYTVGPATRQGGPAWKAKHDSSDDPF
jgi:hypothetical protein